MWDHIWVPLVTPLVDHHCGAPLETRFGDATWGAKLGKPP